MDSTKKFVDGMRFELPSEKAPDFVKGKISIKVDSFINFANANKTESGWLNIDLKVGKSGKAYAELNEWKPSATKEVPEKSVDVSSIPF